MDSAKLKENLFAVAKRAHGGRKCWGHILLPCTELWDSRGSAVCRGGWPGMAWGHPFAAITQRHLQWGHAGAGWGDKKEAEVARGRLGGRRGLWQELVGAAVGRLRWPEAGWVGESRLKWQEAGWGHRDTPDVPACCTSRPQHPRGRQGGIWVPRGSASPTGSLVPIVPPGRRGCGGCVTPGRVARKGSAAAAEPSAPPVYK